MTRVPDVAWFARLLEPTPRRWCWGHRTMPDGTLVPGLFWCDPSGLAGEILPGDSSSYAAPGFHWRVTYPYSRGWENSGHADTQDNAIAAADDWIRYVTSGEMEADAYAD